MKKLALPAYSILYTDCGIVDTLEPLSRAMILIYEFFSSFLFTGGKGFLPIN
jgi:hypothetical protein